MMGASLATGEIIVFCDSDCIYESNWLRNILTLFLQLDIDVVAGETSTPVRNPYELAIAMHYFFPRFSCREHPYESKNYFLNDVAFRRNFLLQNPIPTNLPLYRGNCYVHAHYLCNIKGYKIWKHPQARATHEPPTISFSFWRYLLRGRDRVLREQIKLGLTKNSDVADYFKLSAALDLTPYQRIRSIASTIWWVKPFNWERISAVLREKPHRLIFFPMVVPIILWLELLYNIGSAVTYFQPDWLLKRYREAEGKISEATSLKSSKFSPTK